MSFSNTSSLLLFEGDSQSFKCPKVTQESLCEDANAP